MHASAFRRYMFGIGGRTCRLAACKMLTEGQQRKFVWFMDTPSERLTDRGANTASPVETPGRTGRLDQSSGAGEVGFASGPETVSTGLSGSFPVGEGAFGGEQDSVFLDSFLVDGVHRVGRCRSSRGRHHIQQGHLPHTSLTFGARGALIQQAQVPRDKRYRYFSGPQ